MNLAIEDINTTKKRLKVEIPADVIEKEIGISLQKLKQKAKIPGFRQGMAPLNLLEKRFGKEVEAEVLDKVIPEYFGKALKEANIEPVTFPVIDEKIKIKFGLGSRNVFESEMPVQITKIHGRPAIPALGRETIFKESLGLISERSI